MTRRRILIQGLNYAPEKIGIGPYTSGLAEWFATQGHHVEVVTGRPYYPAWRPWTGVPRFWSRSCENGVTICRTPHYIPRHPTGFRRIVHHASFALASVIPLLTGARAKPDVVIAIVPSSIGTLAALFAARLSGAKLWIHVQDFEIDAALATGLAKPESLTARIGLGLEYALLSRADLVTTISPQMVHRTHGKGVAAHRVAELRNWANHCETMAGADGAALRRLWALEDRFVAFYSGNIGHKQGLEIVIEAARQLSDRQDIAFVICGEGSNRGPLEEKARGLATIRFVDLLPTEGFCQLMRMADCHLLPQLPGAADLVLPSKLANMLASGRPIVATAAQGTAIADELTGCGIVVAPGDAGLLAEAVASLADDGAARERMGRAALAKARTRWRRGAVLASADVLLDRLTSAI